MSTVQTNYTEPAIVTTDNLKHRSFVSFQFNGKPQRLYHGKCLGQEINPNRARSIKEKINLLNKLRFELHKALEAGLYQTPNSISDAVVKSSQRNLVNQDKPAIEMLFEVVKSKIRSDISKKYKRNLKTVYRQFKRFMSDEELSNPLNHISALRIEAFLNQFTSTGTYYMNKRRDLGVLFNSAGRIFEQPLQTVKRTAKKKAKATLHKPYDKAQLKPILAFLESHYPKLYVCCLLTYGSWLRPHEEVRLLTLSNFAKNGTQIQLSGSENKGAQVRVVYVPDYVRNALVPLLKNLSNDDNIFSRCIQPLNESYFNTQWSRAWIKMFDLGLVRKNQTIYSFRHTAAVETYRKTKDVYLLQKLLGHSSITVTLKYLRSLGEYNTDELMNAAPDL